MKSLRYRIEEFIKGETITIFQLKEEKYMQQIIESFAKFHKNATIQTGVTEILKEIHGEK